MWPFKKKNKKKQETKKEKQLNGFYDTDKKMSVVYAEKSFEIQNQINQLTEKRRNLGSW